MGELSLDHLRGLPLETVTIPIARHTRLRFDARQLERWGIPEGRVPAGSSVEFRSHSLWRDYRAQALGALAIAAVQTLLIVGLWLEHRRRRRAELSARRHLVTMSHLDRRAAMGELAASLAHEIGQPLGAILANAKAFVDAVAKAKPSGAKGTFVKKVAISTTMGPGVRIDPAAAIAASAAQ